MIQLSDRLLNIEPSKSVAFAGKVAELKSKGEDIYPFHVGESDVETPSSIISATQKALENQETRYSFVPGTPELRESLAQKMGRKFDIKVSKENVLVGNGSKEVIYACLQALINPGDEVLIPSPYWVTFPESVKLAGGIPVILPPTSDHQLDLNAIEKAMNPKVKAIIFNSPNNPSGVTYPREDLLTLASLAIKNNMTLISDEAYAELIFDNHKYYCLASESEEIFNYTLTIQTFSKSFCMTGFRLGYVVGPENFIKNLNSLQGHLMGNPCTFAQHGALEALKEEETILPSLLETFQKRRDLAHSLLNEFLPCERPIAGLYLFPNIEKFLGGRFKTDSELSLAILENAKVALLPGSSFGCPGHLRICFAINERSLKEGLQALTKFLKTLEV